MATSPVLRSALSVSQAKPHLVSEKKNDIIIEMIDILDDAGVLTDREEAERVVFEREKNMSTGLENGVAIPHGKTDTVDKLVVAVGTKPGGVDFDCADGKAAEIIILTLSPATGSGPHIRFMAEISRLLRDPDLRKRVLDAADPYALVGALLGT